MDTPRPIHLEPFDHWRPLIRRLDEVTSDPRVFTKVEPKTSTKQYLLIWW